MSNIENYGSVWAWNPTLTRTDSGPAGGFNVSQNQKDWQTDYATGDYDSVDNRNIGTKTTPINKINPMEALIAAINKGSYGSGSGSGNAAANQLGDQNLLTKKQKMRKTVKTNLTYWDMTVLKMHVLWTWYARLLQ
jgi:hypothetical protein